MTPSESFYSPIPRQYMKARANIEQPSDASYRLIPLTKGLAAKVSTHRYDYLMQWAWSAGAGTGKVSYAVRGRRFNGRTVAIKMHRAIMGLEPGEDLHVDHINGDTLDNRDENLRIATRTENMRNRKVSSLCKSGYKGIYQHPKTGRWQALLTLGTFDTMQEAIEVRRKAAMIIHGDFYRER